MGVIVISISYGLTVSLLRGSFQMVLAMLLFLGDFGLGMYFFEIGWALTAKAVFVACMAFNLGFAMTFLRPIFKYLFLRKDV